MSRSTGGLLILALIIGLVVGASLLLPQTPEGDDSEEVSP